MAKSPPPKNGQSQEPQTTSLKDGVTQVAAKGLHRRVVMARLLNEQCLREGDATPKAGAMLKAYPPPIEEQSPASSQVGERREDSLSVSSQELRASLLGAKTPLVVHERSKMNWSDLSSN